MSITDQLARLGEVSAPSTLLPAVLAAVAGDQYGLLGEEVWPLWIAWNRDGVAAVMRADQNDEAVFTGWFRKEFGRPLRRATSVPAGLRRSRRYDLGEQTPFERAVLLRTALANNPIPVLIPCHRVIRTDGIIGNYGAGGTEAKKQILSAEGVDPAEMERLARARVRFFGSRTTHIFCLPTCRHARRVQPRYQLEFHSEGEARAKGYRPCKVCRPAPALAG
jgi:O-6-methylguanine DNA methyltransferase